MKAEYRDDIVDLVGQHLRSYAEVGKGMVFGHPGHHVGGRYFCIAYQDGVALKLSQTDYDAALRLEEAEPFSPGGSPMGTWVVLTYPEAEQYLDHWEWIERALAYIKTDAAAPPKKRKKRKSSPE